MPIKVLRCGFIAIILRIVNWLDLALQFRKVVYITLHYIYIDSCMSGFYAYLQFSVMYCYIFGLVFKLKELNF